MLNTNSQKSNQDHRFLVGREAESLLPTKLNDVAAMDIMGLSWILSSKAFQNEIFIGGGN